MLVKDFRTLVYLFIALRVMLLIAYQPEQVNGLERGLTTLGDFGEHYRFASQIRADNLPYRDYWVEFPPVWIGLAAGVAQLAPNFTAWAHIIYLIFLAVDTCNLILLQALGKKLYNEEVGLSLAWVYALLATPLIMLGWNFENLLLCTLLGGFYFSLQQRWKFAIGFISLGILAKYIPLLLLPTLWKFAPRQAALLSSVLILFIVALILIPLCLWGGEMAIQSLTIQFGKPAYQTPWALLDGHYGTGSFPAGAERYDAKWSFEHKPKIPAWLHTIPFALLGGWLFWQGFPRSDLNQLRFFTVTLLLFMLWSQGWSPQWSVILVPLILLNFPHRLGVLLCLAIMLGALMEHPMLFRQTAETGNQITGANRGLFGLLVGFRTAVLSMIIIILSNELKRIDHALPN